MRFSAGLELFNMLPEAAFSGGPAVANLERRDKPPLEEIEYPSAGPASVLGDPLAPSKRYSDKASWFLFTAALERTIRWLHSLPLSKGDILSLTVSPKLDKGKASPYSN